MAEVPFQEVAPDMQWIGVDGGGTKTTFGLFDNNLNLLRELRLPTCHIGQVGREGMREVLSRGIRELLVISQGEIGVGLGLAGYGQDPFLGRQIEEVTMEVVGGLPFELMSDVRAAWAASLNGRDGVTVVCGTGSIAYAVCGARERRAGGWGCQIGDEGSAWWMGRELVRLFSRQADGRDVRSPLFDVVMDGCALSGPYDIISYMRNEVAGDRAKTASLAHLLYEAALLGDESALMVYRRAARELADIVEAAAFGLFEPGERVLVGCVGGAFGGAGELLTGELERLLPEGFSVVEPAHCPAAGPCLLLKRRLVG